MLLRLLLCVILISGMLVVLSLCVMLCIWLSVIWWCFGCILLCSDMLWMVIFLFVSDIVWFFGLSGGGCCG